MIRTHHRYTILSPSLVKLRLKGPNWTLCGTVYDVPMWLVRNREQIHVHTQLIHAMLVCWYACVLCVLCVCVCAWVTTREERKLSRLHKCVEWIRRQQFQAFAFVCVHYYFWLGLILASKSRSFFHTHIRFALLTRACHGTTFSYGCMRTRSAACVPWNEKSHKHTRNSRTHTLHHHTQHTHMDTMNMVFVNVGTVQCICVFIPLLRLRSVADT